jgi:hypothetical protein
MGIVLKDYNIFIEPAEGGTAIAYTTDGTQSLPYGEVSWSPDSKYLVGYKIKRVVDKPVYYILSSQANTTRGQLKQQDYKQPGDEFSTYEMYIIKPGG